MIYCERKYIVKEKSHTQFLYSNIQSSTCMPGPVTLRGATIRTCPPRVHTPCSREHCSTSSSSTETLQSRRGAPRQRKSIHTMSGNTLGTTKDHVKHFNKYRESDRINMRVSSHLFSPSGASTAPTRDRK